MDRFGNLIRNLAISVIGLLTIMPMALHIMTPKAAVSESENRALSILPEWTGNGRAYTQGLEAYINDHFGLRGVTVKAKRRIEIWLGTQTVRVVTGRDGQTLFLGEPLVWDSYRGRQTITPERLENWSERLSYWQGQTQDSGARFAMIIPPNKARILSDQTPVRMGSASRNRLASQLLSLGVVDIEAAFEQNGDYPLYYQTDTHWTPFGAFLAYEAVMTTWPEFPRLSLGDLNLIKRTDFSGDLAALSGFEPRPTETVTVPEAPKRDGFRTEVIDQGEAFPERQTRIVSRDNPQTTLVIIGDSFASALVPFFTHSFDRIVRIHHQEGGFDLALALSYQPDAVLLAPVERYVDIWNFEAGVGKNFPASENQEP